MSARSLFPSWGETLHDLQSASSAEELWGVLLAPHGIRTSSIWEEPYLLFMRLHRHHSTDADMTAALLCTDYRWRNASHHLIDRLASSGVLNDDRLDALADWFSGEAFEISIETPDLHRPQDAATIRRPIWPPLRRWAARHQVERDPERWRDVMDAAYLVPPLDIAALTEIGLSHGSGTERCGAEGYVGQGACVEAAPDETRCGFPRHQQSRCADREHFGPAGR